MDAHAPKCPTCGTAIQPDWDWCHLCGYDPDNLKPVGWISPTEPGAELAKPARRRKRSKKKEARKEAKEPVAAGSVAMSPLLPMAPQVPAPAPTSGPSSDDSSTVDIASMLDPFVSHDDAVAPARPASSIPPLVIEPRSARPTAPTSSEQVLHVGAAPIEVVLAGLLALVGAGVGYLAVTSIIQVAEGASTTMLDNVATVFFILLCAVIAFAALAQARALMTQKVVLTPKDLAVHNRFGRVRKVPRNEIHQLRMSERQYPTPKGTLSLDVPYVQLTDGSVIWLDALGSRSPMSAPTDEQQALYDRLATALASTGTRL